MQDNTVSKFQVSASFKAITSATEVTLVSVTLEVKFDYEATANYAMREAAYRLDDMFGDREVSSLSIYRIK